MPNLIEEIEAAAARARNLTFPSAEDFSALVQTGFPWWTRIKAALEAAQEMASGYHTCYSGHMCSLCMAHVRFRAAFESAKEIKPAGQQGEVK